MNMERGKKNFGMHFFILKFLFSVFQHDFIFCRSDRKVLNITYKNLKISITELNG